MYDTNVRDKGAGLSRLVVIHDSLQKLFQIVYKPYRTGCNSP